MRELVESVRFEPNRGWLGHLTQAGFQKTICGESVTDNSNSPA
jgi:hypothetical protein